jgi:hypothetical protein
VDGDWDVDGEWDVDGDGERDGDGDWDVDGDRDTDATGVGLAGNALHADTLSTFPFSAVHGFSHSKFPAAASLTAFGTAMLRVDRKQHSLNVILSPPFTAVPSEATQTAIMISANGPASMAGGHFPPLLSSSKNAHFVISDLPPMRIPQSEYPLK